MKAKEVIKEIKNNGVSIASSEEKQLIKIQGTLTSSLQLRGENIQEPYYYAFIKLKGQKVDLPTIFKIKDDQGELTKPNLKKSDEVELIGNYSNSQQNV
ncbi:10143_t:CDS:1, partial [Paraglomus brasilianum]